MTKTTKRTTKNRARPAAPKRRTVSIQKPRAVLRPAPAKKKITPALLKEMTRRLVAEFHPEQVILFGSYAWGKPNRDSDVDLMVIVQASNETDYARMVRAYDSLSGLGVPKDVFVKTRAEFERYIDVYASLQNRIRERGQVLYDKFQEPVRSEMVSNRSE